MSLSLFLKGWQRHSALMLDAAGCPHWLIRRRCPSKAAILLASTALGDTLRRDGEALTDFLGIPAEASTEDILAAIKQLQGAQE